MVRSVDFVGSFNYSETLGIWYPWSDVIQTGLWSKLECNKHLINCLVHLVDHSLHDIVNKSVCSKEDTVMVLGMYSFESQCRSVDVRPKS